MYNIHKTIGLPIRLSAKWEELSAGSMPVSYLFANYRRVIVTLLDDRNNSTLYVDLDQFKAEAAHYDNTLDVFIQAKGPDFIFETVEKLPNMNVGYLRYNHAIAAGYHLEMARAGYVLPANAPDDQKTDIKLTRPEVETDFSTMNDYFLYSVNGLLHRGDFDGKNVFIKDAGTSIRIADDNQVGLYSFREISKVRTIKITDEMISIPDGFGSLKERIAITLPADVELKSFILSIGGYMVVPHQLSCWSSGPRTINLNINMLSMLERVLESRDLIDLTSLGLSSNSANPRAIDVTELYSDRVIRKWLTLSQSFITLLDADNIFFDRCYIRQMRAPGIFTAYNKPEYPLVLDQGRLGEYWRYREDDCWSVTLTNSFRKNYQHRREFTARLRSVDGALAFDMPFSFSQAYLFEVGSYQNS